MNVGIAGSEDTFQSRLPTYNTSAIGGAENSSVSLVSMLAYYLKHGVLRQALAEELQTEVRAKHTYQIRAGELVTFINKWSASSDVINRQIQKQPKKCVRMANKSNAFLNHLAMDVQLQLRKGRGRLRDVEKTT